MVLLLLRHGDVAEFSDSDSTRKLSERGEFQARVAGKALVTMGIPIDAIISSPLTRAQQTAGIIQTILGVSSCTLSEYLVPESNPGQIVAALNSMSCKSPLLVGHEPILKTLTSLLVTGSTQSKIAYTRASLGCISVPHPMAYGTGALQWLLTNEQMELFAR
ncbi:MAG: phosphohistidine phosphatase SixA [Bacteroidetes bacterium]|nr:MAG: phosphohistidine phosphatase SixA [Bacteroidota bacterium]